MKPKTKIRKFKLNRGRKSRKLACFYVVKSVSAGVYVRTYGFGMALTIKEAWKTTDIKKARRIRNKENWRARYWKQSGYDISIDFAVVKVRCKCPNPNCGALEYDANGQLYLSDCPDCHNTGSMYHAA